MGVPIAVPKKRLAARFGRTCEAYELGASVQADIARRVADLMRGAVGEGELWCDFGSGGGMLLEYLGALPGGTRIVCLDLSEAPLRRAVTLMRASMAINGDMDLPPIKPETLSGATAISSLQWAASPEKALRHIARTLKPAGKFYFSIFVNGSFEELAKLRSQMGLPPAVWLPDVNELPAMLNDCGFEAPVGDIENFYHVQYFPTAIAALKSVSGIGATATAGRLLNRSELNELCENYALSFSKSGNVPLTYRAVIGKTVKKSNL